MRRRRLGLRAKMTASYVLVTAGAVLLVEAILIGLLVPGLLTRRDLTSQVRATAARDANRATLAAFRLGRLPTGADLALGQAGVRLAPGEARENRSSGLVVPYTQGPYDPGQAPSSLALLLSPEGRVVSSTYPGEHPVGGAPELPVPEKYWTELAHGAAGGFLSGTDRGVAWAVAPVVKARPSLSVKQALAEQEPAAGGTQPAVTGSETIGAVYVQVPASASLGGSLADAGPLLEAGLVLLALTVPVGVVFGLLSTRRLIGRLRRLAASTARVAEGDFAPRVPVAGADEVALLEHNFNLMAERLAEAVAAERRLAGATARQAERSRLARELHDSISQDLFSLGLLAGGLRKALPGESELQGRLDAMEEMAARAMREMRALLLELRPVALEDAGLLPALEELCRAYQARLGLRVDAELAPIEVTPPVEHAVLRVAQEAMANAAKHAGATHICLRLGPGNGRVALEIEDDGQGFDPASAAVGGGLGLTLMRERVEELGGELELTSARHEGTSVRALLPRNEP